MDKGDVGKVKEPEYLKKQKKRRSLAYARLGIPDQSVLDCISFHLSNPNPEYSAILDLPSALAQNLSLRQSFIFRQNATQTFRDTLEAVFFHEISHNSRSGEEAIGVSRVLKIPTNPFLPRVGNLLYSDVEHPAIEYMLKQIWPTSLTHEVTISDLIFDNKRELKIEQILDRYIEQMENKFISVIVIPHVVWINGAILDITSLCDEIKSKNPLVTIIVDGAQAIGHIPIGIESVDKENTNIDFYIGCGHKWLCGPETVGFARVGTRYIDGCKKCEQFLTASDLLTDSSSLSLRYKGRQMGTNQRGLARGLLQAIQLLGERDGGLKKIYSDIQKNACFLRNSLNRYSKLVSLSPPSNMQSGIIAFTTTKANNELKATLIERLKEMDFSTAVYELPNLYTTNWSDQSFCRLSPGPDLEESDIHCFNSILEEVLK